MSPTVDLHVGGLNVELVPGQGRAVTFVDLLSLTSTLIGSWAAVAGSSALSVSAAGDDVVVTWSDALATASIGASWRLRLDGHDKIGGRVVAARPQSTPGDETVAVTLTDPVEVTVEVSGVAVGAVDSVNGETGVVTLSAADVGAATAAQGATADAASVSIAAHITDAVDAHDASAVSVVTPLTSGVYSASDAQGFANETDGAFASFAAAVAGKEAIGVAAGLVASGQRAGSIGLRPPAALVTAFDAWLGQLAAATNASPVDVVVFGDSTSSVTVPSFYGHRPWPLLIESLLGGNVNNNERGWRYAFPEASGNYRTCSTTGALYPGTAYFAAELDAGEYVSLTCGGQTARIVWTRKPSGATIEIRDGSVGGTLITSWSTAGPQKSGQVTDVALPVGYVFGTGTLYAVASGAGTAVVDAIMPQYASKVRVHSATHGGWTTQNYVDDPARGLDLVETITPEVVILATGTNDDAATIPTRFTNLVNAVRAVSPSSLIVMVGMFESSGMTSADLIAMRTTAETLGCVFVDASSVVPGYVASVDGLHPSQADHQMIASAVAGVLTGSPIGAAYQGVANTARSSLRRPLNAQSGATYTPAYTDRGGIVHLTHAAPTVTWPSDRYEVEAGTEIIVTYGGSGTATHAAESGVTLIASGLLQRAGQVVIARKVASNTWHLSASGASSASQPAQRVVGSRVSSALMTGSGSNHGHTAAGVLTVTPIWLPAGPIDRLSVWTTTAAVSTWRLGLYPLSPASWTPQGQARLVDGGTVDMNATAGERAVTVSATIPADGWYGLAVLCDAYTATPTGYTQSTDRSNNVGTPAPLPPGVATLASGAHLAAGWRATGVATGAIPATCPTVSAMTIVPTVFARLA